MSKEFLFFTAVLSKQMLQKNIKVNVAQKSSESHIINNSISGVEVYKGTEDVTSSVSSTGTTIGSTAPVTIIGK
ncbi:MAG: hypothetical protein E7483_07190, partial [Ruminococcaceae bacterium]|nr:hypothetical protein [Oscillospiraceae bacterium]